MARDEIAFLRKADAAFGFEHAQSRNGICHNRRLGIFGQRKLAFGAITHQPEQMLAKRFVDFLKHRAGGGAGVGERFAHANRLAALSWKYKCAHIRSR